MATDALIECREIALLNEAELLLARASGIDDVRHVMDMSEAVRMVCRKAGLSMTVQNRAARIHLESVRSAGLMLADISLAKGGRPTTSNTMLQVCDFPTLAELGITRIQSSRWKAIATLDEQKYLNYLDECEDAGKPITVVGAAKLAKKSINRTPVDETVTHGEVRDLYDLVAAGAKFSTIYADPPWQYSNKATRSAVDAEYASTMTVDQICREPVSQIVHDDAHLHLWTTNAFIFEAKRVLEAWGFEYKSCFVWVKPQMGIGNYWRVSHEFMLLGTRGNLPFNDRGQMSWRELDRTKHSRKPREVREAVESVSPGPYLEMYGREALPAPWTVYGNEVEGSLFDGDSV